MDKIMDLLNNFSFEKYIPKLDSVMDITQQAIELAVRVGPFCILVLGLIYLLIPPKEANRYFGFRTYFGMGSIPAWRFTQRIAGAIMTVTGLILLLIVKSAIQKFAGQDLMEITEKAFDLIKVQIICALVIHVFMFLLTAVLFDRKGMCRFPGLAKVKFLKLLPKDYSRKKPAKQQKVLEEQEEEAVEQLEESFEEEVFEEEEEVPVEYERQGEQVITADDIVIEDLV